MDIGSLDLEELVTNYVIPWGINFITALAVFVIGKWVANLLVKAVRRLMERFKVDTVLIDFLSSLLSAALYIVVVIASLEQLGVNTTSIMALFAAAGLAVGLALKDSLSNFSSGVMLIIFRPFKPGDFVEAAGVSGVVESVQIFNTIIRTGDNREIIVPNSQIYGDTITNYSARSTRRIDLVIGISYDDDIKKAKALLNQILTENEHVLSEPAPAVAIAELGASSVDFNVRPWVDTSDYWSVRSELIETIKLRFDEENITFPFPQTDVHLYKENQEIL